MLSHVLRHEQASDAAPGAPACPGRSPRCACDPALERRRLRAERPQAVPLPALGADLEATSVSGLSAGAFMASQFHIAHSRIVVGVGIVAGGPYGCAEDCHSWFARWYGSSAVVYWAIRRLHGRQPPRLSACPTIATLEGAGQLCAGAVRPHRSARPACPRPRLSLHRHCGSEVVKSPIVDAAGDALCAASACPGPNVKRRDRRTDARPRLRHRGAGHRRAAKTDAPLHHRLRLRPGR